MGRAQNEKHSASSRTEHAPVTAWMASQPGGETYLFINRFGLSTSGAPRVPGAGQAAQPRAATCPFQSPSGSCSLVVVVGGTSNHVNRYCN